MPGLTSETVGLFRSSSLDFAHIDLFFFIFFCLNKNSHVVGAGAYFSIAFNKVLSRSESSISFLEDMKTTAKTCFLDKVL